MLSVSRKRVWEVFRSGRFWALTGVFALLFPAVVAVLWKTVQTGGGGVNVFTEVNTLSVDGSALLNVALVGAFGEAFRAAFPTQASNPGYPMLHEFQSINDSSAYILQRAKPGFPFPLDWGYERGALQGNATAILLPNTNAFDASQFLLATQALAQTLDPWFPSVTVASYPQVQQGTFNVAYFVFSLYGPLLYAIGLIFIIGSLTTVMVRDRAAKNYFLRAGMTKVQYFVGNWMVDVGVVLLLSCAGVIIAAAARVEPFLNNWGAFLLTLALYALGAPVAAYVLSYVFKSDETASRWAVGIVSIVFVILNIPSIITGALQSSDSVQRFATLFPVIIYPPAALSRGLNLIATASSQATSVWTADLFIVFGAQLFHVTLYGILIVALETRCRRRVKHSQRRLLAPGLDIDAAPISIDDVRVTYDTFACCCCGKKKQHAVKDVSFRCAKNEIFCLLGPNGAGKTSLFSVLSGEVEPAQGSASILGLDCTTQSHEIFKRVSFVDQFDVPLDLLSVHEFLSLVARFRQIPPDVAEQRILSGLQGMEMAAMHHQRMTELSGGQRRKVSLVAAMINEPEVLVLDEPTAGVDVSSRRFAHDLITRVVERGGTVLLSSHSMDEVMALASRVAILVSGKLRANDTLRALIREHGSGYLIQAHTNQLDGPAELLRQLRAQLRDDALKVEFEGGNVVRASLQRSAVASIGDLFSLLQRIKASMPSLTFTVGDATLSSAFLKMIESAREEEQNGSVSSSSRPLVQNSNNL